MMTSKVPVELKTENEILVSTPLEMYEMITGEGLVYSLFLEWLELQKAHSQNE